MADLYRKSSLDKLSNPEQLDRMIKISSPLSWLALLGVFLLISATVAWSFLGTLPTIENVTGIIVEPTNTYAVYSDNMGTVKKFYKKIGDEVFLGDKIAEVKTENDEIITVTSKNSGILSALSVSEGGTVFSGTELARITPRQAGKQVVVCYVPLVNAQKFEKGMKVLVYPAAVDSQKYGHMEAEVLFLEEYATNTNSLAYVLGTGNLVAEQFASNGPIVAVVCKLKTDSSTKSGYYWSSEDGKKLTVSGGTIVSAKVIVEECAPITKLIGKFEDMMEGEYE